MISRIVRKHNLALIADEVYREFVYDGAYRSFGTMPELDDNLIIIDSVSKRYSACGARIGCIISKTKSSASRLSNAARHVCAARFWSRSVQQLCTLLRQAIWKRLTRNTKTPRHHRCSFEEAPRRKGFRSEGRFLHHG